ncbi:MAG: ATP-grasp domain-containing protein [Planctomycetota bacterium]|nr:MAG: ATP-grasp domain-containing protein [Planctomycetota bacterium]
MKIGITYDLKSDGPVRHDVPDDFYEEFDSPATVEAVASVLRELGHEVRKLGDGRGLLRQLLADPPDLVFNFAEGHGIGRSREARVPAVLEMLDIPYTGSDPLTLAVTLDKDCAKRLVASYDVNVPRGLVLPPEEATLEAGSVHSSLFPVIVKPAWEGSSKGIHGKSVVKRKESLRSVVEDMCRDYRQPVLIEEFIEGDELTVGVIGNHRPNVIGVMRVVPTQPSEHFIYSLDVKRDWQRQVRYECPARLPDRDYEAVCKSALTVYHALGCRDVARIDFRLRDGTPYFLEVNPLPGLSPESGDLVIMAQLSGCSYDRLIGTILQAALDRCGLVSSPL